MKRLILAAALALAGPLWSTQAAGPDLIIDDPESSAAEEASTPTPVNHSTGSDNQSYGILTGKPIFRLDPRFGDICVRTIFGRVNGAQIEVTW